MTNRPILSTKPGLDWLTLFRFIFGYITRTCQPSSDLVDKIRLTKFALSFKYMSNLSTSQKRCWLTNISFNIKLLWKHEPARWLFCQPTFMCARRFSCVCNVKCMYFVVVRQLTLARGNAWTWAGSCRVNSVKFSVAGAGWRSERPAFFIAGKEPKNHWHQTAPIAPCCTCAVYLNSKTIPQTSRAVLRRVRKGKTHTSIFVPDRLSSG